ncbi:helix-turn-helix domain-containing protein [Candidatus Amarolinea dominans]|uniref:helix-turn-helix domain-containing protein n=1 Tax=Candidatus Amarolinea dominans TaxID=3140696 RepID=UPI0031361FA9|nr:helix-turn-helix domain-containing protein [Anaerolineae bacterium]
MKIREIRGKENQEEVMNQIIDERRTNWLWIDNEVVDRFGPQIGAYGLAVYAVLARFADNRTRVAFPAMPTIAALLNVSKNTILTAIKSLECTEPPLLTVTVGGGRNANTYTLNDLAPHKQLPSPTSQEAIADSPPTECAHGRPSPRGHLHHAPRAPAPHHGHPSHHTGTRPPRAPPRRPSPRHPSLTVKAPHHVNPNYTHITILMELYS